MIVVEVLLEIQVDERAWSETYGTGTDEKLVADVESYTLNQITQSAAANEGAIKDAQIIWGIDR